MAEAECRLGEVAVQASCRQKEAAMRVSNLRRVAHAVRLASPTWKVNLQSLTCPRGSRDPAPPPPTAHLAPIRAGTPDQLPLIAGTCMLGLEVCSLWGHLDSEMGRSWCQSSRPPPALLVIPPAQRLHRWVSLNPVNAPRIQGGTPSPESQHRLQRSRLP